MAHDGSFLSRRQALTGGTLIAARLVAGAGAPAMAAGGTSAIQPVVRHIPMTGVDAAAASRLPARDLDDVWSVSPAVPATGYTAVGVTWARSSTAQGARFFVRTRTGGLWSRWQSMRACDQHRPTSASREAQGVVPGTDPVVVGNVDAVQVKVTATGRHRPTDLTLSVIDPGEPTAASSSVTLLASPDYPARTGSRTPRPGIYSRAQWGADESMRDGFAGYGEIHAAFVHHTVNTNDYSPADVPAILRGIYAYHTQSQGWSDVGYNFLVDRFGRIWEGRWGGIRLPVIGAHTLGYNADSFAMSAIGNFEVAEPSREMLRAYKQLLGWKLSRYGVDGDAYTTINGVVLRTISGHRDVGSTACPGENLYAKLPAIRARVAAAQTA